MFTEREAIKIQLESTREEKIAIRQMYEKITEHEMHLLDRLREIDNKQDIAASVPQKSLADVLEELKEKEGAETPRILPKDEEKPNTKKWEKGVAEKRFNARRAGEIVLDYLKFKCVPVSVAELDELLINSGFTKGNISNRMSAIAQKYETIQKASYGHYQYVPPK